MGPSFHIMRIAGIPLKMHWTFLLLLGWFFVTPLVKGGPGAMGAAMHSLGLVIGVFVCVVLHEFGHALTARRFGIQTRDVTLLPIGGVARLERMPKNPVQELLVALAGPAVNVVIVLLLVPAVLLFLGPEAFTPPKQMTPQSINLLVSMVLVNVMLVVFNMLPAFPMDGGRVLRALLAMTMARTKATQIAAAVGQGMSILFAVAGFMTGNVLLMLVALFVFLGAGAEARATVTSEALSGASVGDAMVRRFRVLFESDSLQDAADELISGEQHDFPVLRDGAERDDASAIRGVLTRSTLIRALATAGLAARVGQFMEPACPTVAPDEQLQMALDRVRANGAGSTSLVCVAAPDGRGIQRLLGMVTPENVSELMMIRSALARESGGQGGAPGR